MVTCSRRAEGLQLEPSEEANVERRALPSDQWPRCVSPRPVVKTDTAKAVLNVQEEEHAGELENGWQWGGWGGEGREEK